MTQRGPWSVKGIDTRAREAAREAAKEEGLTLGAYLNRLILEDDEDSAPAYDERAHHHYDPSPPRQRHTAQDHASASTPSGAAFDRLTRRLESAEARSTLAITGIDQSVVGLLSRLENAEHSQQAMGNHIEGVLEDIHKTYETLTHKIQKLEADDASETNLKALKAIEDALGKLATHVYQEGELVGEETNAIKMRLETGLHELSERMDDMDSRTTHKLAQVDNIASSMDTVHDNVSASIQEMSGMINAVQTRLSDAETSTNDALSALDQHFASLNSRLDGVEAKSDADAEANEEMRRLFEERFEGLTSDLRALIASTRAELAEEIEQATKNVDAAVISKIEENMAHMGARIEAGEALHAQTMDMVGETVSRITESVDQRLTATQEQQTRAIEQVGAQVTRISEGFDQRLEGIESIGPGTEAVREEMLRFTNAVDERLEKLETRETETIDRVSSEVEKLADRLDERVNESERRSASAIEQIGEQVSGVTSRIEERQAEALKAFSQKLDDTQKRQETRLSSALDSVSNRLEKMQEQSINTISPVQRAIAALAQRIEAMEDFSAPPFVERELSPSLPEMVAPEKIDTSISNTATADIASHVPEAVQEDTASEPKPATSGQSGAKDQHISFETEELRNLLNPLLSSDDTPQKESAPVLADTSDGDFEAGYEAWADEAESGLDDTLRDIEALSDEQESPEYYAAPPPPIDTDAGAVLWDDGQDETRDSDIFGDENTENIIASEEEAFDDALQINDLDSSSFDQEIAPETGAIPAEPASAEDFLSKARKAAQEAAQSSQDSTKQKQSRKAARGEPVEAGNKRAGIAAVSTLAVVAIAGTSGALYLRGKQATPPLQLDAQSSQPVAETGEASAAVVMGSLLEEDSAESSVTDASTAAADLQEGVLTNGALSPEVSADIGSVTGTAEAGVDLAAIEALPEVDAPAVEEAAIVAPQEEVEVAFLAPTIPASPTALSMAEDGNGIAQYQLAMAALESGDPAEAAKWMKTAAEQDVAIAQYELAILHEQGLGTTRDEDAARTWHERAAENGNVQAMFDFASYNAEDTTSPQSDAVAAEWFRKAAETGHTNSQYNLALMFATGRGVSPSQMEALYWLELAALGGDTDAAEAASQLVDSGAVSEEAALQVRERAAAWIASPADKAANGEFSAQAWETASPEQIIAAQETLNALGYSAGIPDGAIGEKTREAISTFEAANALPVTGELSNSVIDALNAAANEKRNA